MPNSIEELLRYHPNAPLIAEPEADLFLENKAEDSPPEPSISFARLRLYYLQTLVLRWILNPEMGLTLAERFDSLLPIFHKTESTYTTTLAWPGYAFDIKLQFVKSEDHIDISITGHDFYPAQQTFCYDFATQTLQLLTDNGALINGDLRYFLYQFFKPALHNFPADLIFEKVGNYFEFDEFMALLDKLKERSLISKLGFLRRNAQDLEEDGCSFWITLPDKIRCIQIDLFPDKFISNISKEKQFLETRFCGKFLYNFIHVFDWSELDFAAKNNLPTPKPILELRCGIDEDQPGELFELKKCDSFKGKEVIEIFKLFHGLGVKKYFLNDASTLNNIPLHVIRALSGSGSLYSGLGAVPATLSCLHAHDAKNSDSPLTQDKALYDIAVNTARNTPSELIQEFVRTRKLAGIKLINKYLHGSIDQSVGSLASAIMIEAKKTGNLDDMIFFVDLLTKLINQPPSDLPQETHQLISNIRVIHTTRFFVIERTQLAPNFLLPYFDAPDTEIKSVNPSCSFSSSTSLILSSTQKRAPKRKQPSQNTPLAPNKKPKTQPTTQNHQARIELNAQFKELQTLLTRNHLFNSDEENTQANIAHQATVAIDKMKKKCAALDNLHALIRSSLS